MDKTCDWGKGDGAKCDEPMVGYRFDDDKDGESKEGGYGWLPVCQQHYDEETDPRRKHKA